MSEVKHDQALVNEHAVWTLLCEYHPQSGRDKLRWEAHQIAQEIEMTLYDQIRSRDRGMKFPVSGRWGVLRPR